MNKPLSLSLSLKVDFTHVLQLLKICQYIHQRDTSPGSPIRITDVCKGLSLSKHRTSTCKTHEQEFTTLEQRKSFYLLSLSLPGVVTLESYTVYNADVVSDGFL